MDPRRSRRARRLLAALALGALGALGAAAGALWWWWPPAAAERDAWMADYERLKAGTAAAYANLEDRLRSRRISPAALDEEVRGALARARTRGQALDALRRFTGAFADAHFRVEAEPPALLRLLGKITPGARKEEAGPLPATLDGEAACARLGVRERRRPLAWEKLAGYRALGGGTAARPFLAGVVAAPGQAEPLGVLRFDLFSFRAYPALCAATWEERRPALRGDCDEACQEYLARALESALSERLAAQLEEIAAAGARALVVDLTGNGGGSSVAGVWARALTPARLSLPRLGFVRHPHWARQLADAVEAFDADLARPDLDPAQRELLASARARAEALRREAEAPCALPGLWSQRDPALPCSPVARGLHAGGYVDYLPPGALGSLESRGYLFEPSQYTYREGAWRGALLVLVDRRTASASEYVAALLRDNDAARVLGEPTDGSGCGYTSGGIHVDLPGLGARVLLPDCVRYRRDGTSESEGIQPDVAVPWAEDDDAATRARKALAAATR